MNMIKENPAKSRTLAHLQLTSEVVVVGGGLAGTCAAITAARSGAKVVLIQDRPVLGGNASSEVRLWVLGATAHMGNNNRWAREGGVVDEILIENLYRNPEGNPLMMDTILLEKVAEEKNLTLLLNTAVYEAEKSDPDTISAVRAFCSQNATTYTVNAPVFIDASGDGILGFLVGAAFRIGVESRAEFGELFAPEESTRELLGHSIYFYSKDVGRPVRYVAPSFALKDITKIPRWRDLRVSDSGCRLWWLEWGGSLDTVHESETIKWELWRVAYGVWDYIKNSGQFPDSANLTLEWIGTIPGKRESRRFEGDYMIRQQDLIEQRVHPDAVSFGGWAIDLHPSDGVYSRKPGCEQWHAKGVFQIPYRTMYSQNVRNLFLAGRIISATHIAFGATRVMGTCAHSGQAVGLAAARCAKEGLVPRDLLEPARMRKLQTDLITFGQYIPGMALRDPDDLVSMAVITTSTELRLSELPATGESARLDFSAAMMLPVRPGPLPAMEFLLDVESETDLVVELRISSKPSNHSPDVTLASHKIHLQPGKGIPLPVRFDVTIREPRYVFVCLMRNPAISARLSDQRLTGILSIFQKYNPAMAKGPSQEPPEGSGLERFEFWLPQRRPGGKNLAIRINPPLHVFSAANLTNGHQRPIAQPNAWVAELKDPSPHLRLTWPEPRKISRVVLYFDNDFDHPMETVLMTHPETATCFCVCDFSILDGRSGALLAEVSGNHQTVRSITLTKPVVTDSLEIRLTPPENGIPAALFEVRCYGSQTPASRLA